MPFPSDDVPVIAIRPERDSSRVGAITSPSGSASETWIVFVTTFPRTPRISSANTVIVCSLSERSLSLTSNDQLEEASPS